MVSVLPPPFDPPPPPLSSSPHAATPKAIEATRQLQAANERILKRPSS
jgi:hypothetical protein